MTYTFSGLDHVQLAAPPGAEEQARRFYGEILGLQEIPKPEKLQAVEGSGFAAADRRSITASRNRLCQPARHIRPFA